MIQLSKRGWLKTTLLDLTLSQVCLLSTSSTWAFVPEEMIDGKEIQTRNYSKISDKLTDELNGSVGITTG